MQFRSRGLVLKNVVYEGSRKKCKTAHKVERICSNVQVSFQCCYSADITRIAHNHSGCSGLQTSKTVNDKKPPALLYQKLSQQNKRKTK